MYENMLNQPTMSPKKEKTPTRIVVLGDIGVGKSALVTRCLKNIFTKPSVSGKDLSYRYNDYFGKKNVTLDIVDFNGKNDALLSCADGFLICYSIADRKTFESIDHYLDLIVETNINHPKIAIIGNKIDLYNKREVPTFEGYELAKELNSIFHETSAKIPVIDIRQVFYDLYKTIKNAKKMKTQFKDSFDSIESSDHINMYTNGLFGYSRCSTRRGYFSGLKDFSRKAIATRTRKWSRDSSKDSSM